MEILATTKKSLDAAMEAKMPSLMIHIDARYKRQAMTAASTQAAIVELEAGIASLDSAQQDLLAAAEKPPAEAPPPRRR